MAGQEGTGARARSGINPSSLPCQGGTNLCKLPITEVIDILHNNGLVKSAKQLQISLT